MTTLTTIRSKVRQLTGRKSASQLTDAQIDDQINWYYLYEFPEAMRSLNLRTEYSFVTTQNIDVYPMAVDTFMSFEPVGYVSGYPTLFTEDRTTFHRLFPDQRDDQLLTTATAGAGSYVVTGTGTPWLKGSVMVYVATGFDSGYNCSDDSSGNLVDVNGNILGTIDYDTGLVSVSWIGIPPLGAEIRMQSRTYAATRPTTIFYWDNKLTLRPVPDRAYDVRIIAYKTPTALLTATSSPAVVEWWEALAYGAAIKIFENNKDLESMAEMEQLLEKKLVLLGRRQWFQMSNRRVKTIYSQQGWGIGAQDLGFFGSPW